MDHDAAAAPAPELLTTEEFRRRARISKRTAIRWRLAGIGPKPVRIGPRAIRYRASDVDEFLGLRADHT